MAYPLKWPLIYSGLVYRIFHNSCPTGFQRKHSLDFTVPSRDRALITLIIRVMRTGSRFPEVDYAGYWAYQRSHRHAVTHDRR